MKLGLNFTVMLIKYSNLIWNISARLIVVYGHAIWLSCICGKLQVSKSENYISVAGGGITVIHPKFEKKCLKTMTDHVS